MFLLIQTNGTDFGWPGAALPVSLTTGPTETWIEQTVVIPAGATTLQTGVEWNTVLNGEVLYLNDFEITKLSGNATPEYQYHLKDHLGNVRTTFTTVVPITQMTATFESGAQSTEAGLFLNYPDSPHLNSTVSNAHTGTYSEYLRGANVAHDQVGVAKSFSVMPGDSLKIKAFVKYSTPTGTPSNLAGFATALLSAFNFTAPGGGETGTGRSAINTWGGLEATGYGDGSSDNTHPKLFVTIVLFDRNYTQVDVAYQQVTSSGAAISAAYRVKQHGYAFMYISNEHPYLVDAYFDDVLMQLTPNAVVQQDDYYPFGLTFNSYSRESSVPNNYKYNGKELQTDLGLNWEDYGARMYIPEIGRWGVIDPLAEHNQESSTVYGYADENPISRIDPDGRLWENLDGKDKNKTKADRFRKGVAKVNERIDRRISRKEDRLAKAIATGNSGKVARLNDRMTDLRQRVATNNETLGDLNAVENDPTKKFRFGNSVVRENGEETKTTTTSFARDKNGTYVINNSGTLANRAHEIRHAGDIQRGLVDIMPGTTTALMGFGVLPISLESRAYQGNYGINGDKNLGLANYMSSEICGLDDVDYMKKLGDALTKISKAGK